MRFLLVRLLFITILFLVLLLLSTSNFVVARYFDTTSESACSWSAEIVPSFSWFLLLLLSVSSGTARVLRCWIEKLVWFWPECVSWAVSLPFSICLKWDKWAAILLLSLKCYCLVKLPESPLNRSYISLTLSSSWKSPIFWNSMLFA